MKMKKTNHKFKNLTLNSSFIALIIILLGLAGGTIVIVGDATYDSDTSVNVSTEATFAHLNISATAPYNTLIGYWNFDVNDTNPNTNITYDYSGYHNDITPSCYGGVRGITRIAGPWGKAFNSVGGNNLAECAPDSATLDGIKGAMTLSLWAYIDPVANNGALRGLVAKSSGGATGFAMDYDDRAGQPPDGVIFFIGNTSGTYGYSVYGNAITSAGWYHITGTYDSTLPFNRTNLYINGVFANTTYPIYDASGDILANNLILQFGNLGNVQYGLAGKLDEVMIFNSSLSAAQILDIYNNQSARFPSKGNISFWNLDNGGNTTLNISLLNSTSILGTEINGSINGGTEFRFSNGLANMINFTGREINLTLILYSNTNKFYSPNVIGNISLEIFHPGTVSIPGTTYYPNTTDLVDPGKNITVNATVTTESGSISSVILRYSNGTSWANASMYNSTATPSVFQANISLNTSNANYTFNVWANNTLGNLVSTDSQSFQSYWDCSWNVAPADMGQVAGFDQNKFAGYLYLNNTGDSEFVNGACALSFRLTHNFPAETEETSRIFIDEIWPKPSNTYSLSAGENTSIKINASYTSTIQEESVEINVSDISGRSNVSVEKVNLTLVTTSGGPYLFIKMTEYPTQTINLTIGNMTLTSYIRNIVGDDTQNNTAFNISFNWTFSSAFGGSQGNSNISFLNLSNSTLQYSQINLTLNSTNLPNLSPGTFTINLNALGKNYTGGRIVHSSNRTVLTEQINITLACHPVVDGITITACGSLDGDYVAPVVATTTTGPGGGGGGGGGGTPTISVQTTAQNQLVRGKENTISYIFKNTEPNTTLTNLNFTIIGGIAKYMEVSPSYLDSLAPGGELKITITITSPTYIKTGKQEISLIITGQAGAKNYQAVRKITLEIHEISEEEARNLLEESYNYVEKLKAINISSEYLNLLLFESNLSLEKFIYEKIMENHELIKRTAENAINTHDIISELSSQIETAKEKGIDVTNSERALQLSILALNRQEFDLAFERAKEAQLTFAFETKGEFGRLTYYLKNNPIEISLASIFLALFSVFSYKVARINYLKFRIKQLQEEEKILVGLMEAVQRETFSKKTMSIEEYKEAMSTYERKISSAVERIISYESQRVHIFKFTSEENRLRSEKKRIVEMIKELQNDYLKNKKIEATSYEARLESYNRRIGEIEEKLATLEAEAELKKKVGPGGFLSRLIRRRTFKK